jgi:hypothetical protein
MFHLVPVLLIHQENNKREEFAFSLPGICRVGNVVELQALQKEVARKSHN